MSTVVLVFAGVVGAAAEAEVVVFLVFEGFDDGVVADFPGVAEFLVIGLAGAVGAAEDAGQAAVAACFGDDGGGVGAADTGDTAAGGFEGEVEGVGMFEAPLFSVGGVEI